MIKKGGKIFIVMRIEGEGLRFLTNGIWPSEG